MKTIDLQNETLSADQLLALASSERLLKILKGGKQFLLQEADDFEAEAAELGNSEEFHRFLQERFRQRETISLEQMEAELKSKKENGAS